MVQSIARVGKWNLKDLQVSYLNYYALDALIALGGWEGAANKDFGQFFHERFQQEVPDELIHALFPNLRGLQEVSFCCPAPALPRFRWMCPFLLPCCLQAYSVTAAALTAAGPSALAEPD